MPVADNGSAAEEVDRLNARVRRLAEEKSNLQLVISLIERLNPLPGLEDMVQALLYSIVETIGGTNIKLYYWIENQLNYRDFLGERKVLAAIDDAQVALVAARREFVEEGSSADNALLREGVIPGAWTWTFPLQVGEELIGVIKLENLHIQGLSLRSVLPVFFSHAALILGNEIRSHSRQRAIDALADSEARFRRLVRSAPIPLCYVARDGTIVDFNDRFASVFGYASADIPTIEHWWRLAYPDPAYRAWVVATWNQAVRTAADTGSDILPIEYRVTCKNGDVRVMEISGVTLGDDLLATFVDLTERKKAEDRLRATSRMLDSIIENIPAMIFLKRADDLRFALFNKAGEDLLGVRREDLLGKCDHDFFPAAQADAFNAKDRAVLASDRVEDVPEEPINTRNGRRYLHTRKLCLRNGRGEPEYLLGISDDITEFKKTQEELGRYRQHLEELVVERTAALEAANRQLSDTQFAMDRAGIAIHWVDAASGRFLYVNDQACEMLGYTREELLAMALPDIDPDIAQGNFSELMAPFREQVTSRIETRNRTKGGALVPVEVTSYYLPPRTDSPARFIAFVVDITPRKAAEMALLHARDVAETANRMKSVFLANMSHELRTPLNAILGFAQIMERDPRIPADERGNLRTINRSGRHLLTLINDVLEISRIEAGHLEVLKRPCDLHELIEGARQFVELRARDKGLALRLEQAESLPRFVNTDGGKLRQVLLNLLSNAVKYTERGTVTLMASAKPAGAGVVVEVAVADTGVGIDAEDLRRIFDPFFQANYGVRLGEGTGLGLSIAREYTRVLGGELTAQSIPGQGSVFRISLPVELAAPVVSVTAASRRVLGLAAGQEANRILVVEDDADSRQYLTELLEQVGFRVQAVANGAEAVAAFSAWHPELIWMDMRMPVMDGYEATRRIRALPGGRSVKIVALTASAFQEDRGAIFSAGCDEVVVKPQEPDVLLGLMADLLGIRYLYADNPAPERPPTAPVDLAGLPAAVRRELRHAAEILDAEAVRGVVGVLRREQPETAERLDALLAEFRFDVIAALCGAKEE